MKQSWNIHVFYNMLILCIDIKMCVDFLYRGGLLQTVHSTLLRASSHNLPEYSLEKAKWLWQRVSYQIHIYYISLRQGQHYTEYGYSNLKLSATGLCIIYIAWWFQWMKVDG